MEISKHFNFAKFVFEQSKAYPDKIAYIDDEEKITYKELEQRSRGFAESLHNLGLTKEDRVMISLVDSIDLPVAILGCILGGYIAVLTNPRTIKTTIAHYVEISLAKVILTCKDSEEVITEIIKSSSHKPKTTLTLEQFKTHSQPSDYDPATTIRDSAAYWLFTSGGSGEPKAVVHSHGAMYAVGYSLGLHTWKYKDTDLVFTAAKLFFAYGLCHSFECSLTAGCTSILMEKFPTPSSMIAIIRKHNPTIFATVPAGFVGILNSGLDISNLGMRFCVSAGEMLPTAINEKWEQETDTTLYDLYGTTEFTGALICNREGAVKRGTIGKPVYGYECEIRHADGSLCADGEVGDLYLKGPSMGIWYYNDLERSRKIFQGDWCFSGDKFIRDQEGYYTFVGRSNDMFKVNANWVSPVEIENIIVKNELVQEVGVTGKEDDDGLMQIHAFIKLKPNTVEPANFEYQIKKLIRSNIEHYKTPKKVTVVNEIPKNANGKIQRYLLKFVEEN